MVNPFSQIGYSIEPRSPDSHPTSLIIKTLTRIILVNFKINETQWLRGREFFIYFLIIIIARLSQCVWTTTPKGTTDLNYTSNTQLVMMVKILRCRHPCQFHTVCSGAVLTSLIVNNYLLMQQLSVDATIIYWCDNYLLMRQLSVDATIICWCDNYQLNYIFMT